MALPITPSQTPPGARSTALDTPSGERGTALRTLLVERSTARDTSLDVRLRDRVATLLGRLQARSAVAAAAVDARARGGSVFGDLDMIAEFMDDARPIEALEERAARRPVPLARPIAPPPRAPGGGGAPA